ncbi:MAG: tRNA (cytidine(34)-2'-O)-methyltransferase [Proteobacteria bacterium]|nr:tRNA (cytidine(34)-2'-O)-methyltransferase [Pseudomonadota bacterium]
MVKLKIVLINPLIPQNTGNIARLCAANDFDLHLIGKLGFSLEDKQLKRAGLDYWEYVKLFRHDSFEDFLNNENEYVNLPFNFFVFTKKANKDLFEIRFKDGDALVFGPEDNGFSSDFLQKYNIHTVKIPMQAANVRSLNLSSAVAISSYEALRQIKNSGII